MMKTKYPSIEDHLGDYRKTVRVFGVRREKYLEFTFTVGFEELTVELVLPYPAFVEFCENNNVAEIGCAPEVKYDFDRLAAGNRTKINDQKNIIQLGDFR